MPRSKLTTEEYDRIIRAVRAETGPGFSISMQDMEIILRQKVQPEDAA